MFVLRMSLLTISIALMFSPIVKVLPVCSAAPMTAKNAVVTVPAGQALQTIVTTPISSNHLYLGQTVTVVTGEDFYYNGNLVAPVDSVLIGSVINVSKAKNESNGELLLRFTQLTTPYGIKVPISAIIKNDNKQGKLFGYDAEKEGGADVNIPVTTPMTLVLTQPITVNPEMYNSNY